MEEGEFYPTKEETGDRLGFSLISNLAFVDGNKRIGMYVMITFLAVNGIELAYANDEVTAVGLAQPTGFACNALFPHILSTVQPMFPNTICIFRPRLSQAGLSGIVELRSET